jgi:spore maturation protein CgeB
VDGGHLVEPELVTSLKRKFGKVINLNFDDPFPLKEYHEYPGWRLYRECIPFYDLLVVVREPNVQEVLQEGAHKVTRVFMTADEVDHCKIHIEAAEQEQWKSAVSFIGTWFPERGPFLAELMDRGIPLSIWGNRWQRAREWNKLKTAWRGPTLYNQDYVKAVQSSQICLGLLSKGNRDLHTTRSMEIPAIGSLLCAERTSEHLQLYNEGTEAIFWSNADECADLCLQLLKAPAQIQKIAAKGHERCLANNHFNLSMMKAILDEALTI